MRVLIKFMRVPD